MKFSKNVFIVLFLFTSLTACGGGEENNPVLSAQELTQQLSDISEGNGVVMTRDNTSADSRSQWLKQIIQDALFAAIEIQNTALQSSSSSTLNESNVQITGQQGTATGNVTGKYEGDNTSGSFNFNIPTKYADYLRTTDLTLNGSSTYDVEASGSSASIDAKVRFSALLSMSGQYGAKVAWDLKTGLHTEGSGSNASTQSSVEGSAVIISVDNKFICRFSTSSGSSGDELKVDCE